MSGSGKIRSKGPWSGWFAGEDRSYFWRVRKLGDETLDYQYTTGCEGYPESEATFPFTAFGKLVGSAESAERCDHSRGCSSYYEYGGYVESVSCSRDDPEASRDPITPAKGATVNPGRLQRPPEQGQAEGHDAKGGSSDGHLVRPEDLHAKVSSEKLVKMSLSSLVGRWLDSVDIDTAPISLDAQGLPIYP